MEQQTLQEWEGGEVREWARERVGLKLEFGQGGEVSDGRGERARQFAIA